MSGLSVLVSGRLASAPGQGGAAWAVLQYILGLRRLGHRVYFVEPLEFRDQAGLDASAAYFNNVVDEFGLEDSAALFVPGAHSVAGIEYERIEAMAATCDLLLNISGVLQEERFLSPLRTRVFLDLDPAFTQMWQSVQEVDMGFGGHTHFLTIGEAWNKAGNDLPDCDLSWLTVRQPVVLDEWPVARDIEHDAFTTIANWRAYGSIEYQGAFYGQKAHSLRRFFDLPRRTDERFELALTIHSDEKSDLLALKQNGWLLVDPVQTCGTPSAYRAFVQGSRAEFGIAKSGYVLSRCGWFSDRSACYLASGRPVIAQDTGFGEYIPTGRGLHSFQTTEDFVDAANEVRRNYASESRAARELAEAYFGSDAVLTDLLTKVGLA